MSTEPPLREALDRAALRGDLLTLMQAAMTALRDLDNDGYREDDEGLAHDLSRSLDEAAAALAAVRAQPSLRAALLGYAETIRDVDADNALYATARAAGDYES